MRLLPLAIVALLVPVGAQAPPTPTFEVASIKAHRSDAPMRLLPSLQPSGRVFAINLPLRELIAAAFGLQDNRLIIESKLADVAFDLEARAGANATVEQAALMLRQLLTERFGLKTHRETRQLPVYTLVRTDSGRLGPQIKRSGTECAPLAFPTGSGAPPPPPPPPPVAGSPLGPTRTWSRCPTMFFTGGLSARSMDMTTFAIALEQVVRRPVIDKTGIAGEFDFDITYAAELLEDSLTGAITGARDAALTTGAPSAQRSAPSVFTALRDQLGLRLAGGRAPIDVLVVDDVRQPIEN
jgi:uncharacterized protein (TIGR03435 family)